MQKEPAGLMVTYRWSDESEGMTPEIFGESIVGFGSAIRRLLNLTRISHPVSVQIEEVQKGSIVLYFTIELLHHCPFESWADVYNFFAFADRQDLVDIAKGFAQARRDINDFVAENPIDSAILVYIANKMFSLVRSQKKVPMTEIAEIRLPLGYAVGLHRSIKRGVYKKALRPFVESQVDEIIIQDAAKDNAPYTKITKTNFEGYLSETEQILPEYKDGETYMFAAQLVGLEKSKGEHLKFKLVQLKKPYNILISYVEDDKTTGDYIDFYGKQVFIRARVIRRSMYQKPKLKLCAIDASQSSIFSNGKGSDLI